MDKINIGIGEINIGVGELRHPQSPLRDADHDKWIDVLSTDWGSYKPAGG